MLLLDDTGLITHLNILLIGSAHVGKTTLRKCFVRGPSSHGIPKTRARGPWRSVYDPTIEDCNILQYVLPLSNAPSNSADPRSPTDSTSSGSTISNEHESESKDNIRLTEEDLWQRNVGQRIILTLSDVGGHPFYGTIWPSAIAAADAFMLIYDVGNRQSFDAVFGFYRQILELKCARPAHLPIMLLGNMVDNVTSDPSVGLQDKRPRQVTRDMGDALAKLLRVSFNETSAMAPKSVAHCFRQLLGLAQDHAHTLFSAGRIVKAEAQTTASLKSPALRRPSDASFGSDDAGPPRNTPINQSIRGADRVYGQVGRNLDAYGQRGSAGASRDSMSTNVSDGSAISAGKPTGNLIITNPSSSSMSSRPGSASSSSDGIRDLAAPRPDSIRFRRDMIFRAWKTFQDPDSSSALAGDNPNDSRNVLRSLVSSSGSSGSRPASPGLPRSASGSSSQSYAQSGSQPSSSKSNSLTSQAFSSNQAAIPPSTAPSTASASASTSSPHDEFGLYLAWDAMSRKSGASSAFPTLSSNATSNTNPFGSSRLTTTSSGSGIDVSFWEGRTISEQLRDRARESGWRSPQPDSPREHGKTSAITQPSSVRRYKSSADIRAETLARTEPSMPGESRHSSNSSEAPSLQKSQRDLEMLLEELTVFGFDNEPDDALQSPNVSSQSARPDRLAPPPQFGMTRSRSMGQMKEQASRSAYIPLPSLNTLVEEDHELSPPEDDVLPSSQHPDGWLSTSRPDNDSPTTRLSEKSRLKRSSRSSAEQPKPNMDLLRSILAELDEKEVKKIVEEFSLRPSTSSTTASTPATYADLDREHDRKQRQGDDGKQPASSREPPNAPYGGMVG